MCRKLVYLALVLAVCPAGVAPLYGDDIIWDFENGNDHGFTLWCLNPAIPAADDPAIAGDEALTGVGGPKGLPDAGAAWAVGRPDQYDGFKPAFQEGDKIKADGTMEYNQPGLNHPFTFPVNSRGQQSYLNTYNLTQWGDNVHTQQNDQIATSRLVLLGNGSVLTAWVHGGGSGTHAPELDPNPNEGYTNGSSGIAVLSAVDGSLLDSVLTNGHGNLRQDTIDLSAYAGQKVYVEVVDAFQGSWGWIAVDEIRITNATELIAPPGQASDPNPADEQTDVPQDVILSWTPGEFAPPVNGHKVYFSENFNDVNDGIGGITQDANSYNPGRLNFGTTYYWRVDEVNGPPDYTVHEGSVWSFTTEPFAYVIENITAIASSAQSADTSPENTVNGSGLDDNDLHSKNEADMWLSSATGPQPTWIQYEFDKAYKLHQMWVWNSNQMVEPMVGFGLKDITIEYSVNGIDYTTLGTTHQFAQAPGTPGYAHNTTVDFSGLTAKYIRLTANSNWGGLLNQYGLSEVRFFYIPIHAREPYPDSGATDVDVDVTLGFRAGREAAQHDVYLGTDEQAVIDGTVPVVTVNQARHGPLSLDLAKTYYWKINEVNEAETPTTWEGDLWNFATREFLVVDDFESYNDLDPAEPDSRRIFNVWKDGYEVPTNGSLVGYETPPFCEQTIVHGGKQSMPLNYDNTTAGYSEATTKTADLAIGQDWTKYGIKTLVLYFHGDPSNSVEQLYVKLNGSKVTYNGDVANLTQTVWQEWNIELASFGVNLSNVAELSIGLERIGVAGGKGVVYIDDIRLYPSRCVPEHGPVGDIDDDCKVDFSDYAILVHDWFLSDYSIPAKPITQTPVAHWALDEGSGTITADSAGGHSGTIMGGVGTTWVAGKVGAYALHFNGEDNHYVDCGTFNPTQGRNEMTCAVWAKWDGSNNNWQGLVCKRDTWSVSGMMWQIEVDRNDQRVGVFRNGVDGEDNRLYTLEPLPEGEWQHIAFTINNANDTVLYVDGKVVDSANWSLGTGTNAHVLIGATFYAGATGQDCFNGALDDVYLFNDDLTQSQIIKLMGLEERYFPIESPAELYDGEPQNFRSINFRDLEVLAETWLEERLWPAQ